MSYFYDLHVHSSECSGCAASPVRDQVKACKEFGYAGFVLTNHFLTGNNCIPSDLSWEEKVMRYYNAYLDGKEYGKQLDFDVFFGIEHHYGNAQELLIYGIDAEFLIALPDFCELPPERICQLVRSAGGFVSHAHPYRERGYIPKGDHHMDFSFLDGMEVYNGANRQPEDDRALATADSLGLAYTAGSDLHDARHLGIIPSGGMVFDQPIKTSRQLVTVLKDRTGRVHHVGDRYFK